MLYPESLAIGGFYIQRRRRAEKLAQRVSAG
jgi:hypothetical protein